MKKGLFYAAFIAATALASCMFAGERIDGNGNIKSETRQVNHASKIKVLGGMDVVVDSGAPSVKVEADENLLPYIETEMNDDWIEVKTREHVNLHSANPIKIYITTPLVTDLKVTGSANITGSKKFYSNKNMSFQVTGSGDINIDVNAPKVNAGITGSGNLHIKGETRDVDIDVTGSGNYDGAELKAENAEVKISGSGDVSLFADANLKASISGSGDIKYKGNPVIDKHIAGSGTVMKTE